MTTDFSIVVTSVHPPSDAMREWHRRFGGQAQMVVIGDRKGPASFDLPVAFYSIAAQADLKFRLAALLPESHYARKNLGYLVAIAGGARRIFDTDDDNAPLASFELPTEAHAHSAGRTLVQERPQPSWINVYRYFGEANAWPRGFPLGLTQAPAPPLGPGAEPRFAPIQQFLADGEADVDAVWRLTRKQEIRFADHGPVHLDPGSYCPFNSQATLWFRHAFPLLYLPSTCTSRVADIWRSFVASRCLHAEGLGVCFRGPGVDHARNPHDLLHDLKEEHPGYLANEKIVALLESLRLVKGRILENLLQCYAALAEHGFVLARDCELAEAWAADLSPLLSAGSRSQDREARI